jgi:hypothetical protein
VKRNLWILVVAILLAGCSKDDAKPAPAPSPTPGIAGFGFPDGKPCAPLRADPALAPGVPDCLATSLCSYRTFVSRPDFAFSPDSKRLVALTDASGRELTTIGDQRATLLRLRDLSVENTIKDDAFKVHQGNLALEETGRFVVTSLMGGLPDPYSEFEYEFGRGARRISHAEASLFRSRARGIPMRGGAARFRFGHDETLGRDVGYLLDVASGQEAVIDALEGMSIADLRNFAVSDDGEALFFTLGSQDDPNSTAYREFLHRLQLSTGKAARVLELPGRGTVRGIAPIPRSGGKKIAVVRWDLLSVFDIETGQATHEQRPWSYAMEAFDDGKRILRYTPGFSRFFPQDFHVLDLESGETKSIQVEGRQPLIHSMGAHSMVELIGEGTAIVRDTETGKDVCKFGLGEYTDGTFTPAWSRSNLSPDGRTLAYTTEDGRVVAVRLDAPAAR